MSWWINGRNGGISNNSSCGSAGALLERGNACRGGGCGGDSDEQSSGLHTLFSGFRVSTLAVSGRHIFPLHSRDDG